MIRLLPFHPVGGWVKRQQMVKNHCTMGSIKSVIDIAIDIKISLIWSELVCHTTVKTSI